MSGATPEVYVTGVPMYAPTPRAYPFASAYVQETNGSPVTVTPPAAAVVLLAIPGALAADETALLIITGFYRGATKRGVISALASAGRLGAAAAVAPAVVGGLVATIGAVENCPLTLVPTASGFNLVCDGTLGTEALAVQAFAHVSRQAG